MCTTKTIVFVAVLMSSILVIDGNDDERRQTQILAETMNQNIGTPNLNMTICVDKCAGESCKTYVTPIDQCYSSSLLFPNDPSWSGKDLRDVIICETQTLLRTIFDTENGTCRGGSSTTSEDKFRIPLNECVGPFGEPRPWGTFSLIQGQNKNVVKK
jgi:hypothetical protein